jgi:hypothetical protein
MGWPLALRWLAGALLVLKMGWAGLCPCEAGLCPGEQKRVGRLLALLWLKMKWVGWYDMTNRSYCTCGTLFSVGVLW